jgi:hypothetical protein
MKFNANKENLIIDQFYLLKTNGWSEGDYAIGKYCGADEDEPIFIDDIWERKIKGVYMWSPLP